MRMKKMPFDAYKDVEKYIDRMRPVGSQITCNPAPTILDGSDEDFLVMPRGLFSYWLMVRKLKKSGFQQDRGPMETSYSGGVYRGRLIRHIGFKSYRRYSVNLLITLDYSFFSRFMEATEEAKKQNLLDKNDRIRLFQKILYDNDSWEPTK